MKKVELIVGDRKVRVMEHMVEDLLRYGATKTKKLLKDVPKELLTIPELKQVSPLPPMEMPEIKKRIRKK